jgi:hypothetical protein
MQIKINTGKKLKKYANVFSKNGKTALVLPRKKQVTI